MRFILSVFLVDNEEPSKFQKHETPLKDTLFSNGQHNASVKSYNDAVFKDLQNELNQKYEYELSEKDAHAFNEKLPDPITQEMEDNHTNIPYDEHLKEGLKETFVDDTSSDYQYSDESSTQDSYSVSERLPPPNNDNYIMNEHFPFIPASEWARLGSFDVNSYDTKYQVRYDIM